jgi:hypothetical protein
VSKPHVPKKKDAYSLDEWAKRVKEVTSINTGEIKGKRRQPGCSLRIYFKIAA